MEKYWPTPEERAERRRRDEAEPGHWFMVNRKDLKAGLESGRKCHGDIPAFEASLCIGVKTGRAELLGLVGKHPDGRSKMILLHKDHVEGKPVFETAENLADIAGQWGFEIQKLHFVDL